jgi:hypothetical protein
LDDRGWTTNERRPISNQPGRINPAELAKQDQPAQKQCTVLASRILHELQPQGQTEAAILDSKTLGPATLS